MEKAHYLVCIIFEKTIQQKIAIKQRPFTLNVLKDFQFSRFIMKPVGILSNITQNKANKYCMYLQLYIIMKETCTCTRVIIAYLKTTVHVE